MTIVLTIIGLIFVCLIYYIPQIRLLFLIIALVLALLIGLKVYLRYLKYGKQIFKHTNFDYEHYDEDTIITFLKATNTPYKIVKLKNSISKFLIINRFGIYAIYFTNESGLISGDCSNNKLIKRISIRKQQQIDNFLLPIQKDLKEISLPVQKILITRNDLTITVREARLTTIRLKDFFYWYIKCYKTNNQYTEEQIDQFYKQLSKM